MALRTRACADHAAPDTTSPIRDRRLEPPQRSAGAILVALAAILASGCGGEDRAASGGPVIESEAEIREVLIELFSSRDPGSCTEYSTQNLLDQVTIPDGEGAIEDCREAVEDTELFPDSVEVSAISVEGDRASALVSPQGGAEDGYTYGLDLVLEDEGWKADRLTDVEIDLERAREAELAELEASGDLGGKAAECVVDELFTEIPLEEIEARILDGTAGLLTLDPFIDCAPGGDFPALFADLTAKGFVEEGLPEADARCVADASVGRLGVPALRELLIREISGEPPTQGLLLVIAHAFRECGVAPSGSGGIAPGVPV